MTRLTLSKVASVAGLVSAAGCASILGDFSSGDSPPEGPNDAASAESGLPGAEGGLEDQIVPDGDVGETGSAGEGGGGQEAGGGDDGGPLPLLSCNAWKTPQPFRFADLHTLSGTAAEYQSVTAFSPDTNTVRIVAERSGNPTVFTVYSIDTSASPPAVTSADLPFVGPGAVNVRRIVRLDHGFGVVVSTTNATGYFDLSLYPFRDANPVTPLPTPVPIVQFPETSSAYLRDINLVEVGPGAYFFAMLGQANGLTLEMGVAVGGNQATPAFVDSSTALHQFDGLTLVHSGTQVFIYCAGYGAQPAAFYQVPDTAGSTVPRTTIPGATASAFTPIIADGLAGAAPNTTNLVLRQADLNDAGQFGDYTFHVAPIANAALPTLVGSAISFGTTYADLASAPLGTGPRLFGDDFVAIGQGEAADQNPTPWFNFLWMNASGVVRANRGGVGALLVDRASLITGISAAPGLLTPLSGAWNIVWSEFDPQDAGPGYGALYMNELDCQP